MSFPQLTEQYALRAREFADAVASLGRYSQIGPEVVALMKEIRWWRSLCFEAAERFEQYVQENNADAQSAE